MSNYVPLFPSKNFTQSAISSYALDGRNSQPQSPRLVQQQQHQQQQLRKGIPTGITQMPATAIAYDYQKPPKYGSYLVEQNHFFQFKI